MRTAWITFWIVAAAIETGLALNFHYLPFVALAAVALGMVAYNLHGTLKRRSKGRVLARIVRGTR